MSYGSIGFVGLNPFTFGLVDNLLRDEQVRRDRLRRAYEYYHGDFKPPLKMLTTPDGTTIDDNVYANYCRPVVDKGVDFLFGKGVDFKDDNAEGESEAEKHLAAVWRANKKEITLRKIAWFGAVTGHAFVRILPPDPESGEEHPRLIVLDPATVRVEWDMHDIDRVTRYTIAWDAWDAETGKLKYFRQQIEPKTKKRDSWRIVQEESEEHSFRKSKRTTLEWKWPFSPIVDCQNLPCGGEYWGIADLEKDLLDLQDSINFTVSNIARILRFHAHPRTWGKGFSANQLQIGVNEIVVLPNKEASLQNLEMQSDLHSSINYLHELRSSFFAIARVPEYMIFKQDNVSRLSGLALALLYQPLLDKTEQKRATYGEMLDEINRRLLIMADIEAPERLGCVWPNLLSEDKNEMSAQAQQEVGAKLASRLTWARKLGYDPEFEKKQIEEEAKFDLDLMKQQTDLQTEAQLKLAKEQGKIQLEIQKEQLAHQAKHQTKVQEQQADLALKQQEAQAQLAEKQQQRQTEVGMQQQAAQFQQQQQFDAVKQQRDFEQQRQMAREQSALKVQEQKALAEHKTQLDIKKERAVAPLRPKPAPAAPRPAGKPRQGPRR